MTCWTVRSVRTALALLAASLYGCGPSGVVPVEATGGVTYNGAPIQAYVSFVPDGETGRPATAASDEAGRFALGTFAAGDGALPGQYRVSVMPIEPPPMPGEGGQYPGAYKPPFPAKYGNPATSGFTAEVKEEADNEFSFALTD